MKKTVITLAIGLATLGFQACNQTTKSSSDSVDNAKAANERRDEAGSGEADDQHDFAVKAANGGMAELEAARLAREKSPSADVKAFAAMMLTDHQKANEELKALAGRKTITLPARIGEDAQEDIDELAKLSGADFDKRYIRLMVDDHEEDVKLFKKAAEDSRDPDLKAFAANTLPVIQHHLERINAIDRNHR